MANQVFSPDSREKGKEDEKNQKMKRETNGLDRRIETNEWTVEFSGTNKNRERKKKDTRATEPGRARLNGAQPNKQHASSSLFHERIKGMKY